jgi:hypothetical protein
LAPQGEGTNDIPMGEFWKRVQEPDGPIWWVSDYNICDTVKQAASAPHVQGKRLCQAEAFTSMGPNREEDPFTLKDIGDGAVNGGWTLRRPAARGQRKRPAQILAGLPFRLPTAGPAG